MSTVRCSPRSGDRSLADRRSADERNDGGAAGACRREGHLGRHADGRTGRRARVGLQADAGRARVRLGHDRPHQLRHPGLRPGDRRGRRALRPRARRHAQGLRAHRRPDRPPGHDPADPRGRARAALRGVRRPRGRHRHRHRAAGRQPLHAAEPRPGRGPAAAGRAGPPRTAGAQQPAQGLHRRGATHVQGPPDRRVAHPSRPDPGAVQARGAGDRRRHRRDQGLCPRARPPHEDRRVVQRPQRRSRRRLRRRPGRPGAAGGQRAARREDRHRPVLRRPLRVRRQGAVAGQGQGGPHRRGHGCGRGDRARLPALAGHRQGGPERPPGGAPDRLAGRHQERDAARRGGGLPPAGLGRGRVGGQTPTTGEQVWQPAEGGPAVSAEEWEAALAETPGGNGEPAAADSEGAEVEAPAERTPTRRSRRRTRRTTRDGRRGGTRRRTRRTIPRGGAGRTTPLPPMPSRCRPRVAPRPGPTRSSRSRRSAPAWGAGGGGPRASW